MTAILFKIIYGIHLALIGLASRLLTSSTKFLAELAGILMFKARWYIVAITWILILRLLVGLEPWVDKNLSPLHGLYLRFTVAIIFLMLAAFLTRKLRRSFRRLKLEVKVLNTMADAKKHVISIRDERKGVNAGGGAGALGGFFARLRAKAAEHHTMPDTVQVVEGNVDESVEAMLAHIAANAQAEVDAMLAGKPIVRKRKPWSLGADEKSSKSVSRRAEEIAEAKRREQEESDDNSG